MKHSPLRAESPYQQPSDRLKLGRISTESKAQSWRGFALCWMTRENFSSASIRLLDMSERLATFSVCCTAPGHPELPEPTLALKRMCSFFQELRSPWELTQWFRDQTVLTSPRTKVYWSLNLSLLKNIVYLLPFIFGQTQESMCCRKSPTLSYRPWCHVCSCIAIWF